jgi:hypothetical protein
MKLELVGSKEPEIVIVTGRGSGHDHLGLMVNGKILGYFHIISEDKKHIEFEFYEDDRNGLGIEEGGGPTIKYYPLKAYIRIRDFELF